MFFFPQIDLNFSKYSNKQTTSIFLNSKYSHTCKSVNASFQKTVKISQLRFKIRNRAKDQNVEQEEQEELSLKQVSKRTLEKMKIAKTNIIKMIFQIIVIIALIVTTFLLSVLRNNGTALSLIIATIYTFYAFSYSLLADFVENFQNPVFDTLQTIWSWWITFGFLFGATNTIIPDENAETASLAISIALLCMTLLCGLIAKNFSFYAYVIAWLGLVVASFLPTENRIIFFEHTSVSILRVFLLIVGFIYLDAVVGQHSEKRIFYFTAHFWIIQVTGWFLFAYPIVLFLFYFRVFSTLPKITLLEDQDIEVGMESEENNFEQSESDDIPIYKDTRANEKTRDKEKLQAAAAQVPVSNQRKPRPKRKSKPRPKLKTPPGTLTVPDEIFSTQPTPKRKKKPKNQHDIQKLFPT